MKREDIITAVAECFGVTPDYVTGRYEDGTDWENGCFCAGRRHSLDTLVDYIKETIDKEGDR